MIKEIFDEIKKKSQSHEFLEVRQLISEIRRVSKSKEGKPELDREIEKEKILILELLKSEDAKTRKNTALLIGDAGKQEYLGELFSAYQREDQRFVKSAYLTAMLRLDYREYLGELREQLECLTKLELTDENKKHISEEIRILSDMITAMEGIQLHKFTGYHELSEIILLTNRDHIDITKKQIAGDIAQEFNAGLRMTTNHLERIVPIRTYQELLFLIPGVKIVEANPVLAADKIVKSELLEFLKKRHKGVWPFYFRVEMKSKLPLDKKSSFVKQFTSKVENLTQRKLINNKSNYEFEIRLIQNREGNYNVLVKLNTLADERFDYRKEVIPTSIKPVNAALMVELAKHYMKEDAKVLDPFCGVGTMLIERQKIVKANTSYGIDIMEEAILKARQNTKAAGQIIHYINKNFFDFTHEYLFDEIFTNMPFAIGRKTEDEIYETYRLFFKSAKSHLEEDGTIIMYSHNRDVVKRLAPNMGYTIVKQYEINKKEGTYLFVIK